MHKRKFLFSLQKIYTIYRNSNTFREINSLRYFSTGNVKKLLTNNTTEYVYMNLGNAKKNTNISSVFFTKSKKLNLIKKTKPSPNKNSMTHKNFVGLGKHFVPLVKEWSNSIYSFNKENIKCLPYFDKLAYNLMKSYLNFYNIDLEKNAKSIRARKRRRKASINKTLVGKPNFKHTNDSVLINVYFYNRRVKYYMNKLYKSNTIDNINNKKKYKYILVYLKYKVSNIISLIMKNKLYSNNYDYGKHINYLKYLKTIYIKNFIYKFMQKEINSLIIRQLNYIQKSKVNKFYLLPLLKTIEVLYKKKVNLNFINVKYVYNNVGIFSESIMSKLKRRTVKPTKILRRALSMFKLPAVDRLVLYDEMFNKKTRIQNRTVKKYLDKKENLFEKDILDNFIVNNISHVYLADGDNTNKAINTLKHKFSDGIRLEMAGRLTKRNTAERSIYKLRYRGNIRNLDSSYKGLSATLLRGYANSNVQYKQSKSRIRIGSFGLKTWISSTT